MVVWLTLEETASHLRIGRSQLYALARRGDVPATKIGGKWRFDRDEIDAWMKSRGSQANGPGKAL